MCREILALLRQERSSYVSTFFDFYGLPKSWPGVGDSQGNKARNIAAAVEESMHAAVGSKMDSSENLNRFIPYIQMYEVEALLFSNTKAMASVFERPDLEPAFAQILRECGECEEIDDGQTTAPSKRIEQFVPTYLKGSGIRAQAPIIVKRIGVDALREACPHFGDWIRRLEQVR